MLLPSNYSRRP
jgi:hypothetical protein